MEFNFDEVPVMQVNLSGEYGLVRLKELGEDLQERLEQIPAILRVDLRGDALEQVDVGVEDLLSGDGSDRVLDRVSGMDDHPLARDTVALAVEAATLTGTAAIMAYAFGAIPNAIFFGVPGRSLALDLVDGVVYGLLTGAVFANDSPSIDGKNYR